MPRSLRRALLFLLLSLWTTAQEDKTINGEIGRFYNGTTVNGDLSIYRFTIPQKLGIRITIASIDATREHPLLAVCREPTTIISSTVPNSIGTHVYPETSRTICPISLKTAANATFSIEFSSCMPAQFSLFSHVVENFEVRIGSPVNSIASPSKPVVHFFEFPPEIETVVVVVDSDSSSCMTISVQKAECPIFDQVNNILSVGKYQTITKSGSITVERRHFEKFFIVFLVSSDDDDCSMQNFRVSPELRKSKSNGTLKSNPEKKFQLSIRRPEHGISYTSHVLLTIAACIIATFLLNLFNNNVIAKMNRIPEELLAHPAANNDAAAEPAIRVDADDAAVDDGQHNDGAQLLPRKHLSVADMATLPYNERDVRYSLFFGTICTVTVFYIVPTSQFVVKWADDVQNYGDQDTCWYNFRCARSFLFWYAFNNIISNLLYITVGLLMAAMCLAKMDRLKEKWAGREFLRDKYGLPEHNGFMLSLALSTGMVGILSAFYHFCPTPTTYQFDTTFMYINVTLAIQKLYSQRHPEDFAQAHTASIFTAFCIVITILGVLFNCLAFWICFSFIYVAGVVYIAIKVWKTMEARLKSIEPNAQQHRVAEDIDPPVDPEAQQQQRSTTTTESLILRDWREHKWFIFFIVGGVCMNVVGSILGLILRPADFPSHFLYPLIGNFVAYTIAYIGKKIYHGEIEWSSPRTYVKQVVYLVFAVIAWIGAIILFNKHVSNWGMSPAHSRELNQDCVLFDYYDYHDLWHFTAALAILSTFAFLDCIDEGIMYWRRDTIEVF